MTTMIISITQLFVVQTPKMTIPDIERPRNCLEMLSKNVFQYSQINVNYYAQLLLKLPTASFVGPILKNLSDKVEATTIK